MKAALAIAILLVGLGMFLLAGAFGVSAVRLTRARERTGEPATTPGETAPRGPSMYRMPGSPRGLWAGAGIGAALGLGSLVGAAIVLISVMVTPDRELTAPPTAGGLRRDDSPEGRQLAAQEQRRLEKAGLPRPLAAVYRRNTTSSVLFLGSTGHIDIPATQLRLVLREMTAGAGKVNQEPEEYPSGTFDGTVMCTSISGTALSTCGWADKSTIGVIGADEGDMASTAGLLLAMRADMERKK